MTRDKVLEYAKEAARKQQTAYDLAIMNRPSDPEERLDHDAAHRLAKYEADRAEYNYQMALMKYVEGLR